VSFVVQEVPLGDEVVGDGAIVVVAVGKSLDTRSKQGVVLEDFDGSLPDNLADITRFSTATADGFEAEATGFKNGTSLNWGRCGGGGGCRLGVNF